MLLVDDIVLIDEAHDRVYGKLECKFSVAMDEVGMEVRLANQPIS